MRSKTRTRKRIGGIVHKAFINEQRLRRRDRGGSKKRKGGKKGSSRSLKKTRKRRGGNDEERKKVVEELLKRWQPVKGKGPLPETAANLAAKKTVSMEEEERRKAEYNREQAEYEEDMAEYRRSKRRGEYGRKW